VDRDASLAEASSFLDFVNEAWTPFHCVEACARRLEAAGFMHLPEEAEWVGDSAVRPGGKYYVTRNGATLIAFAVGGAYRAGNGFGIVGAHTDSPCLKLKPVSEVGSRSGYVQVGVQPYGGGLWHTWFDRDLSVAGRCLVRTGAEGHFEQRLVKVERPLMRIPTLAIHLQRTVNDEGFKFNKQTHLLPVLATALKSMLNEGAAAGGDAPQAARQHPPMLMRVLAEELGVDPEAIAEFDLHVCDTQPGCLGGADREFVYAGRLDNLCSTYCSLAGLLRSLEGAAGSPLEADPTVRCVAYFDHEEVGSDSATGAGGSSLRDVIARVVSALADSDRAGAAGQRREGVWERTVGASLLLSADMAHAVHPNYPEKHDPQHCPAMHKGTVIKHNANQRYATTPVTSLVLKEVGRLGGTPLQEFVVPNDSACGSTIGPILSSGLGMRTIDIGAPQLSMHSIREVMGRDDVLHCVNLVAAFYAHWKSVDDRISLERRR